MATYEEKKQRLLAELRASEGMAVGLAKNTSNLFRDRNNAPKRKLDVRNFNNVLQVDAANGWVEAEGMTTYEKLVDAMLAHGVMPAVVPQLKSITLGGAAAGVGIEASSFKYGLVHETILEMEILLPDGRVVLCTPDNEHKDLFFGFPNSYGTLGYALKLKAKAIPVKKFVQLQHIRHTDPTEYFRDLEQRCAQDVDFVDGVVFGRNEMVITLGRFADNAPFVSDYTYKNIYYRSLRERTTDFLTTHDYIWRWDTDWFWCSRNFFVQNPLIRRIVGKSLLNSVTYSKIMRWNSKWKITKRLDRLMGVHSESVIQDVDIPIANAPQFLDFFHREIGILPIWICPIHPYQPNVQFDLFRMPNTLYVNFGFWDVVKGREQHPKGYYNRKIERKVAELGGIKSLYSDSYYEPGEFWEIYNKPVYTQLKRKYDPQGVFKDLYQKCVLRQ
ncbi:MAG: FAD-binding oxidoreductase [Gammaproteobacteria bacterium]|nr:FAD-binding oxidoreductase [Gammaproteobacteria bacterium]